MMFAIGFLVFVYAFVGAIAVRVTAEIDAGGEFDMEIGLAAGMLVGILWPFALLYMGAYSRAYDKKTKLSVLPQDSKEK